MKTIDKNILVIGPSASGKTYIVDRYRKQLNNIYDADHIDELGTWHENGKGVPFPEDADEKWLLEHEYLWNKKVLADFVKQNGPLLLLGFSGNVFEILDLFDKVYFLDTSDKLLQKRLTHPSRKNPFGRTPEQRAQALEYNKLVREKARQLNLEFIDASKSPSEIFSKIVS